MRTEQPKLLITEKDYERIANILAHSEEGNEFLEEELDRAQLVPSEAVPDDTVTMNSRILFTDVESGKESEVTLVYPKDADLEQGRVSVLAPIGSALIGVRVGQTIDWPLPNGRWKKLKVSKVIYQPEASGDWDL